MNKAVISFAAGLLVGFGFGYALYNTPDVAEQMMAGDDHQMMHKAHESIEIDPSLPVPAVSLEAVPDAKDGYNLHVVTSNFKFTPEKVNEAPIANEGHAHIYVNGKKTRLYGNWIQVSSAMLKDGENTIEVTLNANDHSEWSHGGEHIGDKVSVTK